MSFAGHDPLKKSNGHVDLVTGAIDPVSMA